MWGVQRERRKRWKHWWKRLLKRPPRKQNTWCDCKGRAKFLLSKMTRLSHVVRNTYRFEHVRIASCWNLYALRMAILNGCKSARWWGKNLFQCFQTKCTHYVHLHYPLPILPSSVCNTLFFMTEINLSLKFCPTNCPTKYLSIFKNVAEEKDEHYFLLSKYVYSQNRYA